MPHPKNDAAPVPPVRPGNDDCCQSGCDPCVFELYAEAMERYRHELKTWEQRRQEETSRTVKGKYR